VATSSEEVSSRNRYKALRNRILKERQVAYSVKIVQKNDQNPTVRDVPDEVQSVIDKFFKPGGVLCGSIPYEARAKGFEMQIHLEPNARPVRARQYRLTPAERQELMAKVSEFIERGWIEPSTSPWCSSVLFAPKPNGGLHFCGDFRFLINLTIKDQGPLPTIRKSWTQCKVNPYLQLSICAVGFTKSPCTLNRALTPLSPHHRAFSNGV
jgi:hypothetical protein